ncbi:hypothetical protein HaLaN_05364 [Haematococcus lacustris]|uniref:Uncharacterized protein n=1 Tax=Haematococcus lacustris TaxID=44745 RepID=A0A699YKS8_HAELA|nr:hypothetical protein HaLaN_05364 [Haematococcus lacustris]
MAAPALSLLLERVPEASNESAPAVLMLAGAPYFVVPGLLLKEDDLSSGTGCEPHAWRADSLQLDAPHTC